MIRAYGFLDTFALTAALYRSKALFDEGEGLVRTVSLSGLLKAKEWGAAKSVVSRALTLLTNPTDGRPALAAVAIEKLLPKGVVPWLPGDPASETLEFHVPIITNPFCQVHSGAFSGHIPVGQLTYKSIEIDHSATNFGETPRYHLIISIKKPELVSETVG